jgi:hypothetical protein
LTSLVVLICRKGPPSYSQYILKSKSFSVSSAAGASHILKILLFGNYC